MFSTRLKELRKSKGLSQKDLARAANIQPATLSRYENGKRSEQWKILNSIVNTLGTTFEYLSGQTDYASSINALQEANNLSDDQLEILSIYQKLPQKQQYLVMERARAYFDSMNFVD